MSHGITDLAGYCVVSDLPPRQCAGCMGHDGFDNWTDLDAPYGLTGDPDRVLDDTETEYTYPARWGGHCAVCGDPYHAGDKVGRTLAQETVCGGCAT